MGIQVGQLVVKGKQPQEEVDRSTSGIKRTPQEVSRVTAGVRAQSIHVQNQAKEEKQQAAAARRESRPATRMATRTKRNDGTDEEPVVVINGVAKKFHKRSPYMLDMLTTDE